MQVTFGGTQEEINKLLKAIQMSDLDECANQVLERLNEQGNSPAVEYKLPVVEVIKQGGGVKELRINGVVFPCKRFGGVQYAADAKSGLFEVLVSFKARELHVHLD